MARRLELSGKVDRTGRCDRRLEHDGSGLASPDVSCSHEMGVDGLGE